MINDDYRDDGPRWIAKLTEAQPAGDFGEQEAQVDFHSTSALA